MVDTWKKVVASHRALINRFVPTSQSKEESDEEESDEEAELMASEAEHDDERERRAQRSCPPEGFNPSRGWGDTIGIRCGYSY
jgi:hypothetical protein